MESSTKPAVCALPPSPPETSPSALPAIPEGELAPFQSAAVPLPPTVPELIRCFEEQHGRCEEMARSLQQILAMTTRQASTGNDDGRPGGDAQKETAMGTTAKLAAIARNAVASTGSTATEKGQGKTSAPATRSPRPTAANAVLGTTPKAVVARGVVAALSPSEVGFTGAAVAGGVVRGTVMTGKVLGALSTTPSGTAAVPTARAVPDGAPASLSLVKDGVSHPVTSETASTAGVGVSDQGAPNATEIPGEMDALMRKTAALEAAQQLLASTRAELKSTQRAQRHQKEALDRASEEIAQLRAELQSGTTEGTAARLAELQEKVERIEAERRAAHLRCDGALYALAQAHEKAKTLTHDNAFLQEKNTHLEGQLQRLLMSSLEGAAAVSTAATASRLSASETYQKEALEKQISDLRSLVDKLTREAKKQLVRRSKAEEAVQNLQKENAELKTSALHFRRQVNESELELERSISRKEEEERLRVLERDATRLRLALRERSEQFQQEKADLDRTVLDLRRQNRVSAVATSHLLRRIVDCQIRETIRLQCCTGGTAEKSSGSPLATSSAGTAAREVISAEVSATSQPSPSRASMPDKRMPSPTQTHAPASPSGNVDAPPPAATLIDRERQLEELKCTFEQRLSLAEAQRKAEAQQLRALHKELRQALTTSQEEVTQLKRLLELAQRRPVAATPLQRSAIAIATPPLISLRSSFAGGVPDTMTAPGTELSHRDGEYGAASASPRDLSDSERLLPTRAPITIGSKEVTTVECRYDPEHMSTWEAVQVENEALLNRLTTTQEEKWRLTSMVEDLQRECATLRGDLKQSSSIVSQLFSQRTPTSTAAMRSGGEGQLRVLQCLLQETLHAKLELEERLQAATLAQR